nr:hypothetical protein CFP56_38905 [Quercus suber]
MCSLLRCCCPFCHVRSCFEASEVRVADANEGNVGRFVLYGCNLRQGRQHTTSAESRHLDQYMAHEDDREYLPPQGPPPLLSADAIRHLAVNGWLPLDLDEHFLLALLKLLESSTAFFNQEYETKHTLYPPARGTESGFYHVPDEKEYLTLRYQADADQELEGCAQHVWQLAAALLHRILGDISRAGGFAVSAWDTLVEDTSSMPKEPAVIVNDDVLTFLRLFHYYPGGGVAARHVDLGLLTLCVGSGRGLQVLDQTSDPPRWVDAEKPTVVVGDFLRMLLKNRVRAGVHQVTSNAEGRTSIIFGMRPCLKHETDLMAFNGSGIVNTRQFYDRIKRSRFNVNATKDVREQQRQEMEARKQQSGTAKNNQCHSH